MSLRIPSISVWLAVVIAANGQVDKPLPAQNADRSAAPGASPSPVRFAAHRLNRFRSEAVGVADFNGDGKLDIVAGPSCISAPDWKPVKIRTLSGKVDDQGKGYVDDFMNLPLDVDGDGRLDRRVVRLVLQVRAVVSQVARHGRRVARGSGGHQRELRGRGTSWTSMATARRGRSWRTARPRFGMKPARCRDGKRGLVKHVISDKRHELTAAAWAT